jgi:hypothetical protein
MMAIQTELKLVVMTAIAVSGLAAIYQAAQFNINNKRTPTPINSTYLPPRLPTTALATPTPTTLPIPTVIKDNQCEQVENNSAPTFLFFNPIRFYYIW